MNVSEALQKRHSTRAFLDKAVDRSLIETILEDAGHAPSGTNTQPWQVAVLTGETRQKLQQQMEQAFRGGQKGKMDYTYYPTEWEEPYKSRRKACGLLMYSTLDIKREDKQRQLDQWAANYRAFDAPVMLLFFMDGIMQTGSYIDYGMFIQSVMLSAISHGLATCPQAALGEFPQMAKEMLGYQDDSIMICGIALGYEDKDALVNSYRTAREPVESFTRFFD